MKEREYVGIDREIYRLSFIKNVFALNYLNISGTYIDFLQKIILHYIAVVVQWYGD